jgi:hypothetical protein
MSREASPMTSTGPDRRRGPAPAGRIVLWHPLSSLYSAAYSAVFAPLLFLPVAFLIWPLPFEEPFIITLFAIACLALVRGAAVFAVFTADHLVVVNPLRVLRLPVRDIEYFDARPWRFPRLPDVMAVAVRERRRLVPICAVPLGPGAEPGGRRLQAHRLQQVHAWAVERSIPPFHGRQPPRFMTGTYDPLPRRRVWTGTAADNALRGPDPGSPGPGGDAVPKRRPRRRSRGRR